MAIAGLSTSNKKRSSNALGDDPHVVSDERLVAAAKAGDAIAFEELHKRHTEKIFRLTHRITRNREDAEDALQECFLNAFLHLRSFDGRSRFSTWLTRIAMNAALMKLRKNRGGWDLPTVQLADASELQPEHRLADPAPNPEECYAKSEREAILRDEIAKLRPTIRTAVEIQMQDSSSDETAEILGLSLTAVKARLFHARAALRRSSRLHLVVPQVWTHSEAGLPVASRACRQRRRSNEQDKVLSLNRRMSFKASILAEGVSLQEAQS
ncbi:MAG: sigma-70 family RNA polymerase sigma factor [Candidatus Acidiferrum sp.]